MHLVALESKFKKYSFLTISKRHKFLRDTVRREFFSSNDEETHKQSYPMRFAIERSWAGSLKVDFLEIFPKIVFLTRDKGSKIFFDGIFWKSGQNYLGIAIRYGLISMAKK